MICLPTPDNDSMSMSCLIWAAHFIISCSVGFCKMIAVLLLLSRKTYLPKNVYECNVDNIYPKNWFIYSKIYFFLTTLIIY